MAGESFGKTCGNGDDKVAGERQRKVGLIYDETMCKHDTPDGEDHYECPDRIKVIWEKLQLAGVAQRCVVLGGSKAEDKHLQLVHTKKHVNLVKRISKKQKDSRRNKIASQLDSIYLNGGSSEAAYLAAGSVVEVAEKVAEGELDCGFAIVRPPGHHAEVDEAMGFCLFNNVAVAASYLLNERPDLSVKKILIVDWDVHHGNGTQKMFWQDPRVLFFSVHRYDHGSFYPTGDDGDYNMVGEGPGKGFNINVPWEQGGCGDADYLAAWNHILIPVTKEFSPDIILLSAGFDAAIGDPLGGCCVTPDGYSVMLKKLMEFAHGKIVMALEGGYNLDSIAKSSLACVQVLLEEKPIQCSSGAYPLESTRRVIQGVRKRLCTYWPSLADEISWKLIDQKTPIQVTGARTENPKLNMLPTLEPRSTSHILSHSHLSFPNKRKALASGSTSNYRFPELEDVMVEKVLPSFHEELMSMEFEDRIAFGKESSFKAILMFDHLAQENRELRYKFSVASDALMASNENLKNLSAERNSSDALLRELEELKSLLAARDGLLEARRKELEAKDKLLEARLMLVCTQEEEICGLGVKIESLLRERDEAVAKAERLDKELQEDRLRSQLENENMDSEDEDMDLEDLEPDLKTLTQEFKKDIDLVFEKDIYDLISSISMPLEREKMGNVFRCFATRAGEKLPSFENWRPESRDIYVRHAHHISQAAIDFNQMVFYYESLLNSSASSKELEAAKKTIVDFELVNREMKKASDMDAKKLERMARLEKECDDARAVIKANEERFKLLSSVLSTLMSTSSSLRQDLTAAKAKHEELASKYDSLIQRRDREIQKSASLARKKVKGRGQLFFEQVTEYVKALETKARLRSDVNELSSNLTLLSQLEKGDINPEEEKVEVGKELAKMKTELEALPAISFDFHQFASVFADSPPLPEFDLDPPEVDTSSALPKQVE